MRFLFACLCALLVSQATCMTNREFVELMLESADESEVEELYPVDEEFDDPDEDAIMLPGGPDDEVDVENLIVQTGLAENIISNLKSLTENVGRYSVRHAVKPLSRRWRGGRKRKGQYRRWRRSYRIRKTRRWRRRSSMTESEVEELYPVDEEFDVPDEDAIMLPGEPDDEVDVENLIAVKPLSRRWRGGRKSRGQYRRWRRSYRIRKTRRWRRRSSMTESEVEELYPVDEEFDVPDEDTIMLPGEPDDEVDVENLIAVKPLSRRWRGGRKSRGQYRRWRRSYRIRKTRRWRRRSSMTESEVEELHPDDEDLDNTDGGSSDCIQHQFMVNFVSKKIRFPLNACHYATYLEEIGVEMGLTLNGLEIFRKKISVRNPPGLCDGLSGVKPINKVCLELYNVNIHSKSFCLSLESRLNILFKRFNIHVDIGCYQLEGLSEKELTHMMNDTTALADYLSNTDNTMIERSGDLFEAGIKTLPELMQHVEITEIPDDDVTGDVEDADDFAGQMEIDV